MNKQDNETEKQCNEFDQMLEFNSSNKKLEIILNNEIDELTNKNKSLISADQALAAFGGKIKNLKKKYF